MAGKFKLEFDTGNAAFDEGDTDAEREQSLLRESSRLLTTIARTIAQGGPIAYAPHIIRDLNGNRIGQWELAR